MMKTALIAAAVALAGLALPARAENVLDMDLDAANDAFNARLDAAMAGTQRRVMLQTMAAPRVMVAWRSGACGTGLSAQQVAYLYAAAGGCTPQGRAFYAQNEVRNRHFAADTDRTGIMLGGWNSAYRPDAGWAWYR